MRMTIALFALSALLGVALSHGYRIALDSIATPHMEGF